MSFFLYFASLCISLQTQDAINRKCDCFVGLLPKVPDTNFTLCSNYSQNNCSLAEYGSASSGSSQYDSCPSECSSIQYQISKGFKNLDDNYAQFMYGSLSRRLKNSTTVWELKDYALSFGVYYDSLVLVETEQSAKMDAWKVLADISGYMGLFSGTTCLSLAELIEIVIKHFFFQNL